MKGRGSGAIRCITIRGGLSKCRLQACTPQFSTHAARTRRSRCHGTSVLLLNHWSRSDSEIYWLPSFRVRLQGVQSNVCLVTIRELLWRLRNTAGGSCFARTMASFAPPSRHLARNLKKCTCGPLRQARWRIIPESVLSNLPGA